MTVFLITAVTAAQTMTPITMLIPPLAETLPTAETSVRLYTFFSKKRQPFLTAFFVPDKSTQSGFTAVVNIVEDGKHKN